MNYRFTDAEVAAKVVEQLEGLTQSDAEQADVTDEILSVWADRAESPDEIARGMC